MNNFAKNLTLLMKENSISQKELAQKLNVKQQTISRYVNGEREPDIDILIVISKYFDITVDQLVGSEGY
ncbi:MAG: helix-turn-helix domain-containing protein [Firmicutes bacterium]|nr:helix-turn-helix domain-containing protein [Bacillota bacterium]